MRILFFSEGVWDDTNSFGNTVSNWFYGDVWKTDHFSHFYCRDQLPNNKLSISYYCLTAADVIRGFLKGKIQGKSFCSDNVSKLHGEQTEKALSERSRIDRIHNNRLHWVYFINDLVWMSRVWINRYFNEFINKENPDVFFAFATRPYILWPLISYLKKKTKCKIVLFFADDVKSAYEKHNRFRNVYLCRQLKRCIESADKLYAVSEEMSRLYSEQYAKDVSVLYKGCELNGDLKNVTNTPLRFVYAGNLLWGRDGTLVRVAQAINHLNLNGVLAKLEIYTGTTITSELEEKLNIPNASELMGLKPYDEIKQVLHDSDVVLHIESFEQKAIDLVRYSFSTKIIDCLQSGSQVLGIGPCDIASIKYIKKVDGAIVVDDMGNIEKAIAEIVGNKQAILDNSLLTRKYAMVHHNIENVQKQLRDDFQNLLSC